MKQTHLTTALTTPVLSLATVAAWFRNTRTRLFAVAMSLATLTPVFGQPVITVQPQSQSGTVGANVTFSVAASGFEPFSYQWRRNEMALAGEDNATLTLTNLQFAQAGSYTVIVSDGFKESVTSEAAMLTVVADIFTKVTAGLIDAGYSRGGHGVITTTMASSTCLSPMSARVPVAQPVIFSTTTTPTALSAA